MTGSYDYRRVTLSVVMAICAAYAALDLAGRTTASRGRVRLVWLAGGAAAMGLGIWSMHYIGMLAFLLPVPVFYDWPTVLVSLFAAIFASGVALFVVSRRRMDLGNALAGSAIMGSGIATMHYIGMAAMRLPAMCRYDSLLVVLSVVLAIVMSLVALWLSFHLREHAKTTWPKKCASAVVMGAAIAAMHYTGMAAARFTPSMMAPDLSHAVHVSPLGIAGISSVTLLVLGLVSISSLVDRRFSAQTTALEESELLHRELEKVVDELKKSEDRLRVLYTDLHQAQAYLSEAQRLSQTGSFGWVPSSGELIWSSETYRIFDYDPAIKPTLEMVLQRVHPEDRSLVQQLIDRASRTGDDWNLDHRLLMPDGSVKHLHVVAHAVKNDS